MLKLTSKHQQTFDLLDKVQEHLLNDRLKDIPISIIARSILDVRRVQYTIIKNHY